MGIASYLWGLWGNVNVFLAGLHLTVFCRQNIALNSLPGLSLLSLRIFSSSCDFVGYENHTDWMDSLLRMKRISSSAKLPRWLFASRWTDWKYDVVQIVHQLIMSEGPDVSKFHWTFSLFETDQTSYLTPPTFSIFQSLFSTELSTKVFPSPVHNAADCSWGSPGEFVILQIEPPSPCSRIFAKINHSFWRIISCSINP